jgi:parvulin-like peptidyl-prolyl isomerase
MVPSTEDSSKYLRRVTDIIDDLELVQDDIIRDSIFDVKLSEYGGINHDYKMVQDIDPTIYAYLAVLGPKKIAGPIQRADGTYFFRVDDRRVGESEVVKASHILIKTDAGVNSDSAKAEIEKILQTAKSGKEPFAILATTHSQDQGSAPKGGDLGYFKRGMMVPEFDSAAFAGKVGDILGPIKTQFGYHIIYIEDKRNEDLKYSEIRLAPIISTASKTKRFRDAVSIQKQVLEGTPFDTVVARLGLTPQLSPFFEKGKAILGSRYIVDLAYKNNEGDVLEPLELDRYGVVVAIINDVRETGFKSLEDVREEISQRLGKIKLLNLAKIKADELYNKVSGAPSLSALAIEPEYSNLVKELPMFKPSPSVPGVGSDAAFSPNVFKLPENKINQPFRGENAYYIVEVKNRTIPAEDKISQEINPYTAQLQQQSKGSVFYQWFQSLKDKSQIEDFRSSFYKEY